MGSMARFRVALVLLALVCTSCAHRDEQSVTQLALVATSAPLWDPNNPSDSPLVRCSDQGAYDPLYPVDAGVVQPPPTSWLDDPDTRAWYYVSLGENTRRAGNRLAAKRAFQKAARLLQPTPKRYAGDALDNLLRTARGLYELGDRESARSLWRLFLERSEPPTYAPMVHALQHHAYRQFFAIMTKDSAGYTQRNPIDLEGHGLPWIYAGAKAGARGDYARAQADFREATKCGLWDPAYAVFAWGAARYAQGATGEAHRAWLTATVEGDSSPQMPFHNDANAAAITMLMSLY
jgi:tetratricopeptide (TPR) repeat protein